MAAQLEGSTSACSANSYSMLWSVGAERELKYSSLQKARNHLEKPFLLLVGFKHANFGGVLLRFLDF
jgi:hypothetical protein